jgi:hypothetical protein
MSKVSLNRGRPLKSRIRQNIVEILYFLGEGYAYDIYKIYLELFPAATMRSIYYNLKKGVVTQEFVVKDIKREKGAYSWGPEAEKTYYKLGPAAAPQMLPKIRAYFERKRRSKAL